MREIKFRGKQIDGEWVYGDLIRESDNRFGGQFFKIWVDTDDVEDEGELIRVDGSTVGQFTGLKDKNGVDIYEGKNSVKLIIKGCGEGLADIVMHEGKWCVYEPSQGFAPLFDLLNGNSTEIYSNPELLNNNQNN